jgi:DNA gyrase/topoisomerase IV subunit B
LYIYKKVVGFISLKIAEQKYQSQNKDKKGQKKS